MTPRAASHSSAGQTSPGPATSCFCPGPRWKTQDPAQLSLFSKACLDRHHRSAARWGRQRVPAVCFWGFPGYPKATFTLSLNTFNFFPRRLGFYNFECFCVFFFNTLLSWQWRTPPCMPSAGRRPRSSLWVFTWRAWSPGCEVGLRGLAHLPVGV